METLIIMRNGSVLRIKEFKIIEEMCNMTQELKDLMAKWLKKPEHVNEIFNYDGIVNEDEWNKEDNKKILFFLKEAHHGKRRNEDFNKEEGNNSYDLVGELNSNNPWGMWKKVAVWTAAINNTNENGTQKYSKTDIGEVEHDLIKSISVLNVKKSKGYTTSEHHELEVYTKTDNVEIEREIEIIKPKIIVCGNNCSLLSFIYEDIDQEKLHEDHYLLYKDMIILDYYHPANQYPNFVNYYALAGIYQQALKEKNIDL
ncbi:MAG: hypothetical protein AB9888_08090 [Bacteroidales bacterium]